MPSTSRRKGGRKRPRKPPAKDVTPLGLKLQAAKEKQQKVKARQALAKNAKSAKRKKPKPSRNKKRFRRVKVLRWWVLPSIFFVPLAILLVEYYIGQLISLEDVSDYYYQQIGVDPWERAVNVRQVISDIPSLANLTGSVKTNCTSSLKPMINLHNPKSHSMGKIPKILHQHGKNRCMTRKYYAASVAWASTLKRWSYYFHDDMAMESLLKDYEFPEFPLLKQIVEADCVEVTTTKLGRDLWALLVLWLFGGVYVDLNYKPGSFDGSTILKEDDAVFFLDHDNGHIVTDVMAASPRHPLVFYAIQRLLDAMVDGNPITGGEALTIAFESSFARDHQLIEGVVRGIGERSVRIMDDMETSGMIQRVTQTQGEVYEEYRQMGWEVLQDGGVAVSCLRKMYGENNAKK